MRAQPGSRELPRRDPLLGITRLLLDGTNLLHALRRAQDPPPAATLIGRLRAVIPASVRIVLVFDGREDGVGTSRLASGLTLRFSGREPADRLLERLAGEEPGATLVVTDDRELARSIRDLGASSTGNPWLLRRLAGRRLVSPAPGRPLPPTPLDAAAPAGSRPEPEAARDAAAVRDAGRWHPGRGATRKRGNPRRGHRMP